MSKTSKAQQFIATSMSKYPGAERKVHKHWDELRFGSTDHRFLALGDDRVRVEVTLDRQAIVSLGIPEDRIRNGGTGKLNAILNCSEPEMAALLGAVAGRKAGASQTPVADRSGAEELASWDQE